MKIIGDLHPKFGYGRLEWAIKDGKEEKVKILASTSIDEPLFYPFSPPLPLRVDVSGEADFIWGTLVVVQTLRHLRTVTL